MTATRLLAIAARLSGQPVADIACHIDALLGPSAAQPGPWCSTLNNDGSPLQVCVGLSANEQTVVRLLVDPAAKAVDGEQRRRQVDRALQALLERQAPTLHGQCQALIAAMLPADAAIRAALPTGGAWLASNLSGPGMALYVSAKWGTPAERWERAQQWLAGRIPAPLLRHAVLVSAGIEGVAAGSARAKLYWRLDGTASLNELDLPLAQTADMRDFLASVIGNRRIPRGAVVGSTSFDLASGAMSDVKLDLCGHCVPRPWPQWQAIIHACSQRYGLASWPDVGGAAELAFIGLGLDQVQRPRLNVYLKNSAS